MLVDDTSTGDVDDVTDAAGRVWSHARYGGNMAAVAGLLRVLTPRSGLATSSATIGARYLQRQSGDGNSQKFSAARQTPPLCSQLICAGLGGHGMGAAVGVPGGAGGDDVVRDGDGDDCGS